ncbi:MAG: hypothetical protein HF311_09150 [Ignavibacteria bacterium]|nr:hypothetical protein [Ignavibacteria bacterium]MCU7514767.1 hypothetical protein [Ignavibacteria bacterium]
MKTLSIGNIARPLGILILLLLIFTVQKITPAQQRLESDGAVALLKSNKTPLSYYSPYMNAFASYGIKIKPLASSGLLKLSGVKVLVIPSEAALKMTEGEVKIALDFLRSGGNIITEGPSLLSRQMGVKFSGKSKAVKFARDLSHPDVEIKFRSSLQAEEFRGEGLSIFSDEPGTNLPLAAGGSLGKGKFIYLALPLDKPGSFGYERFPYFHEYFFNFFNYKPFVKDNRLVCYVDYGFHDMDDPAELALRLKGYGIGEIHLSGWYTLENCGEFYGSFIEECHKNGILVYLWLELPMVSDEFWNMHPEWRQKKATGEDAALDWRKLMALEVPECFSAVEDYLKKYIESLDWDGVDVAELYFESLTGYRHPEAFTPMSSYVRNEFKGKYGTDPIMIFTKGNPFYYEKNKSMLNKFLGYRAELCTKLNRRVMEFLQTMKKEKDFDIYLTQIDNPLSKDVKSAIGVETKDYVSLQKEFGFTMQAEDPYPLWVLGPDRYKKIGNFYRSKLGPRATLTLDINVVDEGRDDPYPTAVQTGLELLELIREASMHADRVCIYADNTPYPYDYKYTPYALASASAVKKVNVDEYVTESPRSFIFEADTSWPEVTLNGKAWPLVNMRSFIVPAGKNTIKLSGAGNKEKLFITSLSCEVKNAERTGKRLEVSYKENRNVYISLNKKPGGIWVNGEEKDVTEYFNPATGEYTFRCPSGENKIIFEQ